MALEDALDGRRGEVLAVDPQPVVVASSEVEEIVLVAVGEVAGPVPAVANARPLGVGVVPVPLEPRGPGLTDQLTDGLLGVEQPSTLVEEGPGALLAGLAVHDHRAREGTAQRAAGGVGGPLDGRPALRGPVGVLDGAAEPLGEPRHVGLRRLVAETTAQGVLGVVGVFGRGQDVGQGLAHVVEVGDPVAPHVDEELAGAEPIAQGGGGPGGQRRRPSGHEGVGVEERHGQIAHVVGAELVHLRHDGADPGEAALAAEARLGCPGRPRGEEEQTEALLGDLCLGRIRQRGTGDVREQTGVRRRVGGTGVTGRIVDDQDAIGRQGRTEVVPLDQLAVGGGGDQQLTLGVGEVTGELVAPVGRIPAHHDRPGQRRPAHPEHVLGHVVHQQGHVEGARAAEAEQQGRPLGLGPDHVGVGPGAV